MHFAEPVPKKKLETLKEERQCTGEHRALTKLGWGEMTILLHSKKWAPLNLRHLFIPVLLKFLLQRSKASYGVFLEIQTSSITINDIPNSITKNINGA